MDIDFGGPGEGFGDGRAYDDAAALDQARAGVPPPLGPPRNPPTVPDTHWTETGPPPEDYDSEDERKKAIPILPRAYTWKEPPGVRIAYYQAVINNVFKHQSVDQTESTLKTTLMAIDASGGLPVDPVPVQTLVSAKRRLGVDPDEHIIEYAICNLCWKHYRPSEVNHLPSPSCLTPDCPGVIYEESRNTENKLVREPKTISPQVSLIHSLRRIVHRKGFRKLVRDSRNSPRAQNDDPNFVMKDMHDGAMWHSLRTGIKREVGDFGAVRDAAVDEGAEKALTDHRFGLHLTVNTDWFGALKNRPHSCGPIFISIADLPREQRFLQVNVMCVAITPGPKEPTAEQFGHVMEPIVRDACRLKRGVKMDMYDDDDTTVVSEDVYADFICNNCDTPAMHYEDMIRCFGPVYAWWLFAYERFNGMLEKVKLNGHDGGRMELTMLRKWVMSHLIYELLLSLPDDVHPHERSLLDQIIKFEGRGSMLNDIAVFRSEASVHSLDFDLYELMYEHARTTWPTIQLRRELSHAEGISFVGNRVARRLPYVKKDGIRYGCIANNRTQADSFAFILRDSARKPIQILDLFLLEILVDGRFLRHPCALVRRLKSDNRIPDMPWNLFASVLGIYTSYAEQYHPPEIIPASDIDCPLALIPAKHFSTNVDLWISVSFDHVSIEPEEVFEDDE
ncbi:hypothetical protein EST38_g6659 [Candolleomyces aberdarensis]|uniref:Uncharacterized protein n=1 Tax=Candolleomyces aberdarensis TaxID=2316362 RepID=A0A4Q2DH87_9AGAR|nr:hypothetical protein EST38_g6659 [Candolleomyces aberdarensis]